MGQTMVGPGRFELPTSPLSGVRSNQLSYGPDHLDPGPAEVVVLIQERKRNVGGDAGHHPNPKTRRLRGQGTGMRDGDLTDPILF